MRSFLTLLATCIASAASVSTPAAGTNVTNIVFLLLVSLYQHVHRHIAILIPPPPPNPPPSQDDWGWANFGIHNKQRDIVTPNLDALANGGIILDRHYVRKGESIFMRYHAITLLNGSIFTLSLTPPPSNRYLNIAPHHGVHYKVVEIQFTSM
jgi:hypothetical protein